MYIYSEKGNQTNFKISEIRLFATTEPLINYMKKQHIKIYGKTWKGIHSAYFFKVVEIEPNGELGKTIKQKKLEEWMKDATLSSN